MNDGLNLESLFELGDVQLFDITADELIAERAWDAEIILVNKVKLNESHFKHLPKLRFIGETATGIDNIDLIAAEKRGIIVKNVPNYATDSVAQHVIALLLNFCNPVDFHNRSVQRGEWQAQPHFSYWLHPLTELSGLTLGLVGFGQIAQKVAIIAKALGMKIIAYKPQGFSSDLACSVSLADLFMQSDVLSLHCPLNNLTDKLINSDSLKQMKASSILINTSRGGLIAEDDLAFALNKNQIKAAYLDALTQEPPKENNPLLGLNNCFITPHLAWATEAARKRLLKAVCENIIHYLEVRPKH
ncbi:MAG: D-2-hydroxyacid dehydrogenase [Tatlockia sp.]|nr:D-2-hydroxyacid dehydrogenase [Tatlockia sp.]